MFQNIKFLVQSDTEKSGKKKIILDLKWQNHSQNTKQNQPKPKNHAPCDTMKNENFFYPTSNLKRLDFWFHLLHTEVSKLSLLSVLQEKARLSENQWLFFGPAKSMKEQGRLPSWVLERQVYKKSQPR